MTTRAMLSMFEPDWMADARCKEFPQVDFFPTDSFGFNAAQRICAKCVVRTECLAYALDNVIDHGVWGGESERSRRKLRSARRRAG